MDAHEVPCGPEAWDSKGEPPIEVVLRRAVSNPKVQSSLRRHKLNNSHIKAALSIMRAPARVRGRKGWRRKSKKGTREKLREILSSNSSSQKDEEMNIEDVEWLDAIETRSVTFVELHLSPFRSFEKDTFFQFREGGTNFIMAPNGHGKTTILEAIRFLFRGELANNLAAAKNERERFLWKSLPISSRNQPYPEARVAGVFIVDGHDIEVIRTIKSRMYPDSGADLGTTLSVSVDGIIQSEPEESLEKWFGRTILLDYHIFDAEKSRVRFTEDSDGDKQGIKGIQGSNSVVNGLQEYIGLDVITKLVDELKITKRNITKEINGEREINSEWEEYLADVRQAESVENAAKAELESCTSELNKFLNERENCIDRLGDAESAAELIANESELQKHIESNSLAISQLQESLVKVTPWLHIILASDSLRQLGKRNSGDEARRIIDFILQNAPLNGSEELVIWLQKFKSAHLGEPGASELIGRSGWENVDRALLEVRSIRIQSIWGTLQDLRQERINLSRKKKEITKRWEQLPEQFDLSDRRLLAELGKKKNEVEVSISQLEERQHQLRKNLHAKGTTSRQIAQNKPVGTRDSGRLEDLLEESDRVTDLIEVMDRFQTEVTNELRKVIQGSVSHLFQRMMRKEGIGLTLDHNYRFKMVQLGSSEHLPLPSAGEQTMAVIAFLTSLQQVTGLQLPLIIDSALHRLDIQHQSNVIGHFTTFAKQAILFLTDKDWESFNDVDKHAVINHGLSGVHPPSNDARIESLDSLGAVSSFVVRYAEKEDVK